MTKSEIWFLLGIYVGLIACKIYPKAIYERGIGLWILTIIMIRALIRELVKIYKK